MTDSPELAGQKLLDMMPDGCTLETSVEPVPEGWKATACIENPHDTPKPRYVGRGASEEAALNRAIFGCWHFWEGRRSGGLRDWNPLTQTFGKPNS